MASINPYQAPGGFSEPLTAESSTLDDLSDIRTCMARMRWLVILLLFNSCLKSMWYLPSVAWGQPSADPLDNTPFNLAVLTIEGI